MNQAEETGEVILYIGSHKIAAFEGFVRDGEARVRAHAVCKNPEGFENGFVTSLDRAAATLESLVRKVAPSYGENGVACYVVLGNARLKTFSFSSSQYYQGFQRTVSAQDVRQVISQTRSVATLPLTEIILQALPESFIVNDQPGVQNPVGLEASRLGVNLKIHTMPYQEFKNISKALEAAEIEVKGCFPKTLTASEAVLTDQEKQDGALLVDLADGGVHVTLWRDGALQDTRVLAGGSRKLTEAIATEWGIDAHDAEKVKERYGSLDLETTYGDELIPLVDRNGNASHSLKRQAFHEKFIAQVHQWLEDIIARSDAFSREYKVMYPHYVFTGGGAFLDGFSEFVQTKFSRHVRLGRSVKIEAANELLVDLSLASALGMFRWLAVHERERQEIFAPRGFFQKTIASARDWFFAYF